MFKSLEILRTSFFPLDVRGGTKLVLGFDGSNYVVTTRFERLFRSKDLARATARFEAALMEVPR